MKRFLAPLLFIPLVWAEGMLEVVPDRVEFEIVEAGKISRPKKIKIKNIYGRDVVFGSVNIAGRDFLDFRIGKDYCSYTILKPSATCEVEVFFQPRPLPKKEKEDKEREREKVTYVNKEGLFVIPFSELPALDKSWKMAIPLQGTALIGEKKE